MNPVAISVLTIFILILFNAFFAAIEISLVSLGESKINLEIKKKVSKALRIKKLKENPTHFLSVVQVMIHILTFLQGQFLNKIINHSRNYTIGYIIEGLIVILSVILGEMVPKRIALAYPLKTSYLLLNLFSMICFLTTPFVWFLDKVSNLILYFLAFKSDRKNNTFAEDELRILLNSSYRDGIIDSSENKMIQNIFDFDGTLVTDIMRHRKEIVAIKSDITREEIIDFISNEKYTRFPVYEENIDNIIGIVHVKDVFQGLLEDSHKLSKTKKNKLDNIKEYKKIINNDKNFNIKSFLRKAYYVMEFTNISELFKEMQLKRNHIAIVVDEYGGTAGIVTIEDVIEEILGDIRDEYDKQEIEEMVKISDKEYLIRGTIHLCEVEDKLKANLPIDDYETLSGFILGQIKRMPDKNEKIEVIYNDWKFNGLTNDGLVITKIRITKLELPLTNEQKN